VLPSAHCFFGVEAEEVVGEGGCHAELGFKGFYNLGKVLWGVENASVTIFKHTARYQFSNLGNQVKSHN